MAASSTKQRLLKSAQTLMLANGYKATSVDQICNAAGLSKGSFYHFFEGKEALGLAVLRFSLEEHAEALSSDSLATVADPIEPGAWRMLITSRSNRRCSGVRAVYLGVSRSNWRKQTPGCRLRSPLFFRRLLTALRQSLNRSRGNTARPMAPQRGNWRSNCSPAWKVRLVLAKAHADWRRIPSGIRQFQGYLKLLLETIQRSTAEIVFSL